MRTIHQTDGLCSPPPPRLLSVAFLLLTLFVVGCDDALESTADVQRIQETREHNLKKLAELDEHVKNVRQSTPVDSASSQLDVLLLRQAYLTKALLTPQSRRFREESSLRFGALGKQGGSVDIDLLKEIAAELGTPFFTATDFEGTVEVEPLNLDGVPHAHIAGLQPLPVRIPFELPDGRSGVRYVVYPASLDLIEAHLSVWAEEPVRLNNSPGAGLGKRDENGPGGEDCVDEPPQLIETERGLEFACGVLIEGGNRPAPPPTFPPPNRPKPGPVGPINPNDPWTGGGSSDGDKEGEGEGDDKTPPEIPYGGFTFEATLNLTQDVPLRTSTNSSSYRSEFRYGYLFKPYGNYKLEWLVVKRVESGMTIEEYGVVADGGSWDYKFGVTAGLRQVGLNFRIAGSQSTKTPNEVVSEYTERYKGSEPQAWERNTHERACVSPQIETSIRVTNRGHGWWDYKGEAYDRPNTVARASTKMCGYDR